MNKLTPAPSKSFWCSLLAPTSLKVTTVVIQCVPRHMNPLFICSMTWVILLFLYLIKMESFESILFSSRYMCEIHPSIAYNYRSFILIAVRIS